jgi:FkbM family methyltransferase
LIDRRFFFHKTYEDELFQPICSIIKNKKINYFFDIGSCWGIYSLRLSNKFENLKIFSYDPIEKNIHRLNNSIKINNIENIQTFRLAIGNKESIVELGATEDYSPNYEIGEKNAVIKETCKMNLLDNLHDLEKKNIVIKIDTEGFEDKVLNGAVKLLTKNNVFCQIEIKDKNIDKVFSFFKSINYNLISDNKFNRTDYFFSNFDLNKIEI